MIPDKYDFSGYATKFGIECSDGRTIRHDAFSESDGATVSLMWHHFHEEPSNVIGHAYLENRPDGVYAYGIFNDTDNGKISKKLVMAGDIQSLSIYANQLRQEKNVVTHGVIREVSLVLSGANPKARIDYLAFAHEDGGLESISDEEAVVYPGPEFKPVAYPDVEHAAVKKEPVMVKTPEDTAKSDIPEDMTVEDVLNTLTPVQKDVVYALVAEIMSEVTSTNEEPGKGPSVAHSNIETEEGALMHQNVFDQTVKTPKAARPVFTPEQFSAIMTDAKKQDSLKKGILAHADEYGIEDIDFLFADPTNLSESPIFLARRMEWVDKVVDGAMHTPFSKIRTIVADITEADARARGYVKGEQKKDEIFKLLKRVTTAKTIYKKQKIDRDDLLEITSFDFIAWLKLEMKLLLKEEIGRAILVGDGREVDAEGKIDEDCVRPVWTDDDMYSHKVRLEEDADTDDVIDYLVSSREFYAGSGNPTLFTTTGFLTKMLLLKDTTGRRIYADRKELEGVLGVSAIVEVPVMAGLTRESDDQVPVVLELLGIILNMADYCIGADRGGEMSWFENFDIEFNQQRYLSEVRISGALRLPKAAIVMERVVSAG